MATALVIAGVAYLVVANGTNEREDRPARTASQPAAETRPAFRPKERDDAAPVAPSAAPAPAAAPAAAPAPAPQDAPVAAPAPAPVAPFVAPAPAAAAAPAAPAAPLTQAEILARVQAGEPGFEVLASRIPVDGDRIVPKWKEGDEWVVETFYRQMQSPGEPWTGPARWSFRIAREVGFRDRPCFEFIVEREGEPDFTPAVFYVTRDTYRLAGVQTTVQERGKMRTVVVIPDGAEDAGPQAIRAPMSIVPFDLPPVGAEARVGMPGVATFTPKPETASEASLARMPRPEQILGAGGRYLDVEYENPRDGTTVRQRWSREDMRWPAESRTETTWSFRRRAD